MIKVITFLKRKAGMSHEEFRKYYEEHHAPFGINLLLPEVKRYFRRYVQPMQHPITGETGGAFDYDVIMETWFENNTAFERTMKRLSQPEIAAAIAEDEERLFDRSRIQSVIVDEVETTLPSSNSSPTVQRDS